MRSRTYYPIAGLLQVNNGQANYLLDPTTIDDFEPFVALLENPAIIKAMHSCSEDLEVIHRLFGILPVNILDTQIAAAMLGYGYSVGFGNLCRVLLDVDLPKTETRSNWLQRPLSQSQLEYAAVDVEYLTIMATQLMKALQQKKRLSWLRQECEKLTENFDWIQDPSQAWKRGKGLWKLQALNLSVYKALSAWREKKAQERDVPRNRILQENSIMTLAQALPNSVAALKNIEGLGVRTLKADGEHIVSLVKQARAQPIEALPQRLQRPLPSEVKTLEKQIRQLVQAKADSLDVSVELLMRKKDYHEFIRSGWGNGHYSLPSDITGWRREILEEFLLHELASLIEGQE